jgi:hypothetical protein
MAMKDASAEEIPCFSIDRTVIESSWTDRANAQLHIFYDDTELADLPSQVVAFCCPRGYL